jgi:hypothetical protein
MHHVLMVGNACIIDWQSYLIIVTGNNHTCIMHA